MHIHDLNETASLLSRCCDRDLVTALYQFLYNYSDLFRNFRLHGYYDTISRLTTFFLWLPWTYFLVSFILKATATTIPLPVSCCNLIIPTRLDTRVFLVLMILGESGAQGRCMYFVKQAQIEG
jgi:hypothetical protein